MEFGLYEDDTVKEFLYDLVLVLVIRVCNRLELDLGLLVDCSLGCGCHASVLYESFSGHIMSSRDHLPMPQMPETLAPLPFCILLSL